MIILGPPESREPTRLRSLQRRRIYKNLPTDVFRCGRKGDLSPTLPPTLAIFASLLFPSFSLCVRVTCVCVYCSRVLRFALRDLPSTNLQLPNSVIGFLYGPSSCPVLRWIFCPTRARPAASPDHPIICLSYMPLMSILRLAVFLSL